MVCRDLSRGNARGEIKIISQIFVDFYLYRAICLKFFFSRATHLKFFFFRAIHLKLFFSGPSTLHERIPHEGNVLNRLERKAGVQKLEYNFSKVLYFKKKKAIICTF